MILKRKRGESDDEKELTSTTLNSKDEIKARVYDDYND
jgi:hypothetical protein